MNRKQSYIAIATLFITLTLALTSPLSAQSPAVVIVPPELSTAKTVFVSNAGEEVNGLSERAMTQLIDGLKQAGHYQLVSSPASADLIFELHYITTLGPYQGQLSGPNYVYRLRLVILDRSTHVALWTVTEFLDQDAHSHNFDLEFADSVNLLLDDVKAISAGQLPTVAATAAAEAKKEKLNSQKTRFSQEKP